MNMVFGNSFGLGIQKTRVPYIHAWLRGGRTNTFPTHYPQETTRSTTPTHQIKVWRKSEVCRGQIFLPLPGKRRQRVHPGSHMIIPILFTSGWLYHACSTWIHFHSTSKSNRKYYEKGKQMDYATTRPGAIITFQASDTILTVHSDALYLSETNARGRTGGNFFISSDSPNPPNNGSVLVIAQIIKAVMS